MAKIVLGIGSSHGPTMRTVAEKWELLGKKDMEDRRFDFEAVRGKVKPDIESELAIDKQRERYQACQHGIGTIEKVLGQAKPDTIVVLSNLHGDIPDYHQQIFGVYLGDSIPKNEHRGESPAGPGFWRERARDEGREEQRPTRAAAADGVEETYPADPVFAKYLFETLNEDGFDVHSCDMFGSGGGISDAFNFIYDLYARDGKLPMVPFMISRCLPNQATPKRAYALGKALRRAIDAWDSDKRVVVMASGGLSHQIVDEELDRAIVKALVEKDVDLLCSLPRDRLNGAPGTPESLNWVAVAAAMDKPMTLVDYVPCYRSIAGTGHGVTFGYWEQ